MWFNIDWNILALDNLLTMIRKPLISAFAQILLKPVNSLYYKWYNWRQDNIYKLEHTGQVCSLEGSLNDKFDPLERRIYITDGQFFRPFYIYTEGENKPQYLYTEGENNPIYLRTESETADTGLDFIVYVPEALINTQIHELRAHVNFYKAGGKRYEIFNHE
ncbi:hypothetical protein [Flavobacterium gelatinilyticum]|uniref:hypothetical protein n=1 Tax=Flavobacterium gelatinilyticum TaxID=3003260 RepID=UPI00248165EB|nr:hypothetical protein [Flavobacterium gelatinilyticum]